MRPITVVALGVVTAVALAGTAVVVVQRQPATTLAKGQRLFPDLEARLGDAATIEVVKHDGKFDIVRHGDDWVVPDKSDYPARADMVRKTLVGLAELETIDAKTRSPELYGRLNLQDIATDGSKAVEIDVKDAKNAVIAGLLIGKKRTSPVGAPNASDMIYVRKVGDGQTWLAQGQLDVHDGALDWAQREIVDIAGDTVASVELDQPGLKPVVLFHDKPEDKDFKVRDIPANKTVKSQWDVNNLASVLEAMTFDDVAKDGTLTFGPPKGTGVFHTKDGLAVTVTLLPKDAETWIKVAAAGDGAAADAAKAITARTTGWVYKIPDYKRDKLLSKLDDLVQEPKPAGKPQG